jgi:hypothetical protein
MQRRTAFQFDCQEPEGISATKSSTGLTIPELLVVLPVRTERETSLRSNLWQIERALVAEFTLDDSVNVVCETTGPLAGEAQS